MHYSPLKTEAASSSIRSEIKPIFPLTTSINYREDLELPEPTAFNDTIKRKLLEKAPLTEFADEQKTMIMMLLKQSIFRERL